MYVQIADIESGPGLWKDFSARETLDFPDLETDGDVSVDLRITNAGTRMLVQGAAQTRLVIRCARCNEPYPEPIDIELDENFVPAESPEAEAEGLEKYEILTYREDRIVLDEMLRQNFLAAVPIQPICRNGKCRGLCDQCGADLNNEKCSCEHDEIDPRWAALKTFNENASGDPSLN